MQLQASLTFKKDFFRVSTGGLQVSLFGRINNMVTTNQVAVSPHFRMPHVYLYSHFNFL